MPPESIILYERSLTIERRLETVLDLIRSGSFSTPAIAEKLGVSVPTVSRDVTALRERGFQVQAKRRGNTWRYVLAADQSNERCRSITRLGKKATS